MTFIFNLIFKGKITSYDQFISLLSLACIKNFKRIRSDWYRFICLYLLFVRLSSSHALAEIVRFIVIKSPVPITRLSNHDNYWKETTMTFISNHKQKIISVTFRQLSAVILNCEKHPTLPLVYQKFAILIRFRILSGGGSGHEPAQLLDVGEGMLTAAIYGQLFNKNWNLRVHSF